MMIDACTNGITIGSIMLWFVSSYVIMFLPYRSDKKWNEIRIIVVPVRLCALMRRWWSKIARLDAKKKGYYATMLMHVSVHAVS